MKLIFLSRERKKERKVKIGETTNQLEIGSWKGSARCGSVVMGKKIKL